MTTVRPPLPEEVQVEVTSACNLRCRMCLVRYQPPVDRVTGTMTFEAFTRVVDPLPALSKVTLQGLGEPLLVPDLVAMVRHAAERGMRVGFNTNGTLLTKAKAEALVAAGLDWLHVSIDGATAATYEAIRDGARFERVTRNVRLLMSVVGDRPRPKVCVVSVVQRSNRHELPDLVRLVAELGVRQLRVQNLSHDFSDTQPDGPYGEIRAYTAEQAVWDDDETAVVFERARAAAVEVGVDLRLPEAEAVAERAEGVPGCDWPWRSTYVTSKGKVQPCCMVMGVDRAVMGDVLHDDLATVWAGDAYVRFRERLLSADDPPEVCRGCSAYRGRF